MKAEKHSKFIGQYTILTLLLMSALAAAYWNFLHKPLNARRQDVNNEITALQQQLQQRQKLLNQSKSLESEYLRLRHELTDLIEHRLPPQENAMAWSSEYVRQAGRKAQVSENDWALKEHRGNTSRSGGRNSREEESLFELYEIEVNLRSPYHQFGTFIAALETGLPYVHIDSFSIHAFALDTDQPLQINLNCVFPRFRAKAFPANVHPYDEEQLVNSSSAVVTHIERSGK